MNYNNILKGIAAFAASAAILASCTPVEEADTLSVNPSAPIEFEATGNSEIILSVTTNAPEWSFTVPEWVEATKGGKALTIVATDNTTTEERVGRIVVSAGNAADVKIAVSQKAGGVSSDGIKASVSSEASQFVVKTEEEVSFDVKVVLEEAAKEDVTVSLAIDGDYLAEYNYLNGEEYELFPEDKVTFGELTVKAGETEASATVSIVPEGLAFATGYLVPVVASAKSGVSLKGDDARVNVVVFKSNPREVKNVVYLEVNDVNPLNILEYKMTDGSYFFDAVILFAANINYNAREDVVYLSNNPNVQALLDESEVYIQPLRKAGIKVYLGLLGNHDAAGLCQLSDWGAAEWAKEVAQACRDYKLDGVNLDDEYSGSPLTDNKWFAPRSGEAGGRLMYELKKAMKQTCSWPTEVSFFDWGSLYSCGEMTDQETGEVHTQSEFIDFHVANYGSYSRPFGDLTLKHCSGASIQLNYGNSISESRVSSIKEDGYGWIMWFAFDPSGTGSIPSNRTHSVAQFRNVAAGLYGLDIVEPTGVYNKIGEGKYDPTRYVIE